MANHYVIPQNGLCELANNSGNSKIKTWSVVDCCEDDQALEQFGLKFKNEELAEIFETQFQEAGTHNTNIAEGGAPASASSGAGTAAVASDKPPIVVAASDEDELESEVGQLFKMVAGNEVSIGAGKAHLRKNRNTGMVRFCFAGARGDDVTATHYLSAHTHGAPARPELADENIDWYAEDFSHGTMDPVHFKLRLMSVEIALGFYKTMSESFDDNCRAKNVPFQPAPPMPAMKMAPMAPMFGGFGAGGGGNSGGGTAFGGGGGNNNATTSFGGSAFNGFGSSSLFGNAVNASAATPPPKTTPLGGTTPLAVRFQILRLNSHLKTKRHLISKFQKRKRIARQIALHCRVQL